MQYRIILYHVLDCNLHFNVTISPCINFFNSILSLTVPVLNPNTDEIGSVGLTSTFLQNETQIAKFMGPTWGPPGSFRPQMGPMLAPQTLLSGEVLNWQQSLKPNPSSYLLCYWQMLWQHPFEYPSMSLTVARNMSQTLFDISLS